MRTLHVGLRISDLARSVRFYSTLGYKIVGEVPETDLGHLVMLKLPDDPYVAIELVDAGDGAIVHGNQLSHLVVSVESMSEIVFRLARNGIQADAPTSPDGTHDFLTSRLVDPDGNVIELVQWPSNHQPGMTAADFAPPA
jgi:lactoylglutathione lyase